MNDQKTDIDHSEENGVHTIAVRCKDWDCHAQALALVRGALNGAGYFPVRLNNALKNAGNRIQNPEEFWVLVQAEHEHRRQQTTAGLAPFETLQKFFETATADGKSTAYAWETQRKRGDRTAPTRIVWEPNTGVIKVSTPYVEALTRRLSSVLGHKVTPAWLAATGKAPNLLG